MVRFHANRLALIRAGYEHRPVVDAHSDPLRIGANLVPRNSPERAHGRRRAFAFGILALGHKESIHFTPFADRYEEIDGIERIYRKVA